MLLYLCDLIGVAVFAISGALAAGRIGLDWLGVSIIAAVTAIGGGTLRDILLARPVFWLRDPIYLYVILGATLLTIVWGHFLTVPLPALLILDALGLALFALAGAQIAEEAKLPPIIIVLAGTMTGVAGGVVRDVLCDRIPLLLRGDIYATAAIVGILVYLLVHRLGTRRGAAFAAGFAVVFGVRLAAIVWGLNLPVFRFSQG
ncbi:trimeric intracellular cation channel family protein [Uliginosibacterium sp. H1]|uniref:trimeric intracellular cation channel family protein n=1 Tax=Uliginosibacterium sp. H1 TaxID=3114757 RepID=UPI002E1709F7|nr:trimeric intracellular cation channel family protein [Uliginosibacterium sp. H1]